MTRNIFKPHPLRNSRVLDSSGRSLLFLVLVLVRKLGIFSTVHLLLLVLLIDDQLLEEVEHESEDGDENDEQVADLGGRAQVGDINSSHFHARLLRV